MTNLQILLQRIRSDVTQNVHCRHVAVRLSRLLAASITSRNILSLKYLCEDLLDSVFNSQCYSNLPAEIAEAIQRASIAEAASAQAKPAASADSEKQAQASRKRKREDRLEDVQLLFEYLHPFRQDVDVPSIKTLVRSNASSESLEMPDETPIGIVKIWECLKPLMPARGSFIAKSLRMEELVDSHDGSLTSLITTLDALLDLMAQLCAPARDEQVIEAQDALSSLREFRSSSKPPNIVQMATEKALRLARTLAAEMQADMRRFSLGVTTETNTEATLRNSMRTEAMNRERDAVCELGIAEPVEQSLDWAQKVLNKPDAKLNKANVREAFIKAMFSASPVSMLDTADNQLPPIFYVSARRIHRLQNQLQACTIVATLSTLVKAEAEPPSMPWSERVWTLLQSELDESPTSKSRTEDGIRIANISDEIIRVVSSSGPLGKERKDAIRTQVNSMLRLDDPVYALLSRRLKEDILQALSLPPKEEMPMGFRVSPLPREIRSCMLHIANVLEWAYTSWKINL